MSAAMTRSKKKMPANAFLFNSLNCLLCAGPARSCRYLPRRRADGPAFAIRRISSNGLNTQHGRTKGMLCRERCAVLVVRSHHGPKPRASSYPGDSVVIVTTDLRHGIESIFT